MPRKKLYKKHVHYRVEPETSDTLNDMALAMGYTFHGKGAVGEMLDAIAQGDLILVPKRLSKINK